MNYEKRLEEYTKIAKQIAEKEEHKFMVFMFKGNEVTPYLPESLDGEEEKESYAKFIRDKIAKNGYDSAITINEAYMVKIDKNKDNINREMQIRPSLNPRRIEILMIFLSTKEGLFKANIFEIKQMRNKRHLKKLDDMGEVKEMSGKFDWFANYKL